MDLGLKGQRALVTASSNGIGLEIARALAAEGAQVVINGRSQRSVDAGIASIRAGLPQAALTALVADNGTADGCAKTIAELPAVDILVNNLGIYEAVGFFDESDADWQRLFDVNIMSGVRLARHYLAGMLARDRGRVVFISSESGISPAPEMAHYSATKTMQLGISRSLAELTKGTQVTVNAVLPGPTRTESVEAFIRNVFPDLSPADAQRRFMEENRPSSLIARLIDPAEIGAVVAFIASARAAVINGAAIRAEGGLVRSAF
jgi:3-oxoacyl-[acyl-carrier protein] reductase